MEDSKYEKGLANLLEIYYDGSYIENKTAEDLVHNVKVRLLQSMIYFRDVTARNFGHQSSGFAHLEV